jgi:hypothetical protein
VTVESLPWLARPESDPDLDAPSSGKPVRSCWRCMTWTGDELGHRNPDDIGHSVDVSTMRRTCAVVSPPGSAPSPSTSSLLSMVSTSKWIVTREQPVAASQSPSGPHWRCRRRPRRATQPTRPGRETRSLADDLQGLCELGEDDLFGLDPIGQLEAGVVHGDRRGRGWALVHGQDRREDRRADGVAPAGQLEGEFGGEGLDTGGAGALPLRPQQPQGHLVGTGIAAR